MSKIRTLLGAFHTVRYIDEAILNGGYRFEKYPVPLPFNEGEVMLNGPSGQ